MSHTSVSTSKKGVKNRIEEPNGVKNRIEEPNTENGHELVRERMISDAAYFRAEKRGFDMGDSMDDWLVSEAEIDDVLRNH